MKDYLDRKPRRVGRRGFLTASAAALGAAGAGFFWWPERWRYIVIHHSAGDYGSIEFLQRVHRDRQPGDPIDAIPYHFVIGNGNGLGMGEIASDWRRDMNIWGTHVSGNNKARNFLGLGICLIGNYELNDVPDPQFKAAVSLTRMLMNRYEIPIENVGFHGRIEGESSQCPGHRFPVDRFRRAIAQG